MSDQSDRNVVNLDSVPQFRAMMDQVARAPGERIAAVTEQFTEAAEAADLLMRAANRHSSSISHTHNARTKATFAQLREAMDGLEDGRVGGGLAGRTHGISCGGGVPTR